MRILHYYLGPHRQGGMNRYATDLALAQVQAGDDVFALYPSGKLLPHKHASIKKNKPFSGIKLFELSGGTPVPLFCGIREPEKIISPPQEEKLTAEDLKKFCDLIKPEVFHIHTLMGLPEELFNELKSRNVTVVFTTHDYFGLCPKVNFINRQGVLCPGRSNLNCSKCNCDAPDSRFLSLRNSKILLKIKGLVKFFSRILPKKKRHSLSTDIPKTYTVRDYEKLFRYYRNILLRCDRIHFNSENSKKRFLSEIPELSGKVIAITHASIVDRKRRHRVENNFFRLLFIGSAAPYKGLPTLINSLQTLSAEGINNWSLDIWGCEKNATIESDKIHCHGFFASEEEEKIFANADLLIVPSIWEETFGFVVAEALSCALPVICSDMVGAKMLVSDDFVYTGAENLTELLKKITKNQDFFNKNSDLLYQNSKINTILYHVGSMKEFYISAKTERGK